MFVRKTEIIVDDLRFLNVSSLAAFHYQNLAARWFTSLDLGNILSLPSSHKGAIYSHFKSWKHFFLSVYNKPNTVYIR